MRGSPLFDVRTNSDAKLAENILHKDRITLILIYADWCGHCHTYLPQWDEYANLSGRKANILKVHHDMVEHIPTIQRAKIKGYPSVLKVSPNGSIQEYTDPLSNETTNALPHMRDVKKMRNEFKSNNLENSTVANIVPSFLRRTRGGSFRSPKRSNRRGSTRKHRR